MAEEGFKRKLTAILSADVEGYSRLMDDDEDATIRTLTTYRNAISDLVQQFRGRVVDTPGDNILAEFASAVDAVNSAVEIQRELAERNAELLYERKMEFRIGVNVGDVVEEEGRIYGDGVNIAARVESLAAAGGICISGRTYDQVANKLGLEYENLGEHQVKNISTPIRVYRVLSYPGAAAHRVVQAKESLGRRWRKFSFAAAIVLILIVLGGWLFHIQRPTIEPASVEKMALTLPEKPSIAVLPFDNMSGDSEQAYFSDGITEEIISALSKTEQLFVISRNSTFAYKGKPVKVKQVAEELGVRYVLEGSVRKSEDRVRVTAQLIDATKGYHLWSERYERDLKDIFAVQDDITKNIITELQVKLTSGESVRLLSKGTENLQAYLKYWQAQEKFNFGTKEDNILARRLIKEAITLDPEFPVAYVLLGWTHTNDVMYGVSKSPKASFVKAMQLAKKSIAIDESSPGGYSLLGWFYIKARKYEKAITECERAVALAPNSASSIMFKSIALRYVGRHEEAVGYAEQAVRLNPMPSAFLSRGLGISYMFTGRYQKAIDNINKALNLAPNDLVTHVNLAVAYMKAGQEGNARTAVEEALRINPKLSLVEMANLLNYKNQADNDMYIDALRKAGLPENPPLPLPDKPSIAVLAFDNLSGNPEQESFCDGISENIITALSKVGELFVIARNSSFTYKGKPVKIQQIGRELGVRYVLEGSVQKSGESVRITAQLIDATTGQHLWAEKYERELKNFFDILDDVTKKIVVALQVELSHDEQFRMMAESTNNLDAWVLCAKASSHVWRITKRDNMKARELIKKAIEIDPNFAAAWLILAGTHITAVDMNWSKDPRKSVKQIVECTQKAISLDGSSAMAHYFMSEIHFKQGNHQKAIEERERALSLEPNSANIHWGLSKLMRCNGKPEEAIRLIKMAMRLSPYYPELFLWDLAKAYHQAGRYEDAVSAYKQLIARSRKGEAYYVRAKGGLVVSYLELEKEDEALTHASEVLKINPNYPFFFTARANLKYEDLDHIRRLLRPVTSLQTRPVEKEIFMSQETPIFRVAFPKGSKNLRKLFPSNLLRMRSPRGFIFYIGAADIPQGMSLAEIGPKQFVSFLQTLGSNFEVTSNKNIKLSDGTEAYRTEIEWQYQGALWVNTIIVSAFKEGKWVYSAVNTSHDPKEAAWVAESMTFD